MPNARPYAIHRAAADSRYLICEVSRLPDVVEYRAMLRELVIAATPSGVQLALLDARAVTADSYFADALAFGESLAELLPMHFRLATLVSQDAPNRRFLVTTALNRGIYMHYFTEHEEALAWLFRSHGGGCV